MHAIRPTYWIGLPIFALAAGALILLGIAPQGAVAAELTLAWDANTESDLDGYGVYFQKAGNGLSYDLYGYVRTTELSDANSPEFTVTGLQQGTTYYFAVTAYDASGNESAYSNTACAQVGPVVTPCPSPSSSSSAAGPGTPAGGGDSGGCFIQTVSR